MQDAKVLVTGARGFIAGHCIRELLDHGYAVRGSVRDLPAADVAHLHVYAGHSGGSFELVEASLDADAGWAEAVDGCQYVWHLASPVPSAASTHKDEIVRPAVDGTLRVLRAAAASGSVRRVVLTSSIDSIRFGHTDQRVRTEADWSNDRGLAPYAKSKLYAERAAWSFAPVRAQRLELVTISPGLVLGPLLHTERTASMEVPRLLLAREVPAVPRISFAVVDVRDVATAHRLAMEIPAAAGNRYICAGEHLWMDEIASVMAEEFAPRGYRVPTRTLPSWLVWTAARFDPTMRRALELIDVPVLVSSAKARRELGWTTRSARASIVDAAESLLEFGIVRRSAGDGRATPTRFGRAA